MREWRLDAWTWLPKKIRSQAPRSRRSQTRTGGTAGTNAHVRHRAAAHEVSRRGVEPVEDVVPGGRDVSVERARMIPFRRRDTGCQPQAQDQAEKASTGRRGFSPTRQNANDVVVLWRPAPESRDTSPGAQSERRGGIGSARTRGFASVGSLVSGFGLIPGDARRAPRTSAGFARRPAVGIRLHRTDQRCGGGFLSGQIRSGGHDRHHGPVALSSFFRHSAALSALPQAS